MKNPDAAISNSPWRLLIALGVLIALATVVGFFGQYSWILDLFSHFRIQYALGLMAIGLFLSFGPWKKAALLCFLFAFINSTQFAPLFLNQPHAGQSPQTPSQRIVLINVNAHSGNPERVARFLQQSDPDILILQEVSSRWSPLISSLQESYPHTTIRFREDNFGIALLSKLPIDTSNIVFIGSAEVPSIIARLKIDPQHTLHLLATHPLPPIGKALFSLRNEQLSQLPAYIPANAPVILIGDLNTTPWNSFFKQLVTESGLMDSSSGKGFQPTWPNTIQLLRIPLDHCLHSPDITLLNREIGPDVGSDHFPLIIDFALSTSL